MECVSHVRRKNPTLDKRERKLRPYVDTPCGLCGQCLTNKGNEWALRLKLESSTSISTHFLTLTYQESEIPYSESSIHTLSKEHLTNFIKRLRNDQDRNKTLHAKWEKIGQPVQKIRYYAVGEYGGRFDRPHYHIILFNTYEETINNIPKIWTDPRTNNPLGITDCSVVKSEALKYVTKYHINKHAIFRDPKNKQRQPPFSRMSRMPAIGNEAIMERKMDIYKNDSLKLHGIHYPIPQVFKNKLYPNELAQMDLKQKGKINAHVKKGKLIRKLKNEGFTYPHRELDIRAEALNKKLIKNALKHAKR